MTQAHTLGSRVIGGGMGPRRTREPASLGLGEAEPVASGETPVASGLGEAKPVASGSDVVEPMALGSGETEPVAPRVG